MSRPDPSRDAATVALEAAFALHRAGRLDEAEYAYRSLLESHPADANAWHLLGLLSYQRGSYDRAVAHISRALALQPDAAWFHYNLGNVYRALGRNEQAVQSFQAALARVPTMVEAIDNQAASLLALGRAAEAESLCRHSLTLRSDNPQAMLTLGAALVKLNRTAEAEATLREAAARMPRAPEPLLNLAGLYADVGRLDEAVAAARRAIALRPESSQAHAHLGLYLQAQGLAADAVPALRRSVELKPVPVVHSNLLYALWFHPDLTMPEIFIAHREYARRYAEPLAQEAQPHPNDRNAGRRLRVGYVSPALRSDPVGLFIEPVLRHHDPNVVDVTIYSDTRTEDDVTARLRALPHRWRSTSALSDAQFAEIVRRDRIDLLVDLCSHLAHNRMLAYARKPAPVQATYLSMPCTTGLSAMDYLISDPFLHPPELGDEHHSERIVRLHCFSCFEPPADAPEVNELPAKGNGFVTFISTNDFSKVDPRTLGAWAELMRRLPRSRLLLRLRGGAEGNASVLRRMESRGLDLSRLDFVPRVPRDQYLRIFHGADLSLDPFPYAGYTTSHDSLWMGVPVVTLAGKSPVSRNGASVLSVLALRELIASTPEQYIEIAAALSHDLPRLAHLRQTLRERMRQSPLMDAPRFTRALEQAYREMWRAWCSRG